MLSTTSEMPNSVVTHCSSRSLCLMVYTYIVLSSAVDCGCLEPLEEGGRSVLCCADQQRKVVCPSQSVVHEAYSSTFCWSADENADFQAQNQKN